MQVNVNLLSKDKQKEHHKLREGQITKVNYNKQNYYYTQTNLQIKYNTSSYLPTNINKRKQTKQTGTHLPTKLH